MLLFHNKKKFKIETPNCPKRKRSKSSSKRSTVLSILVYNQKFNDYGIMIVIILCTYIVIITSRRSSVVKFTISNKL
ncbi:unnamed protein product [Rhizophagus irregularis]|nr:unnamed protein product [Rhizophagus irregularis]